MTTLMTERILSNRSSFMVVDNYLGFQLYCWKRHNSYHAKPLGWDGPTLGADSLPILRKLIWRWWHQVPANG